MHQPIKQNKQRKHSNTTAYGHLLHASLLPLGNLCALIPPVPLPQVQTGGARLLPGRTGWPVIGESLEFFSTGRKGHPEKFIFDRMAKYSPAIFRTHLLGERAAVFCGATGNKFLFSNENKLVQSWWPSSVDKIFPSSIRTSYKEESIKMRKMLPNFLQLEALHRHIGIMDHIARHHFAECWDNKKEVVVFPLAKNYTFRIAFRVFLSIEDPKQLDKFARPFNLLASGVISIPIDLPGTRFNKGTKASNFIREELVAIIKQRKLDLTDGNASCRTSSRKCCSPATTRRS